MQNIQLITNERLNGKRIAYSSMTEFLVQIGKGRSKYRTEHRVVGSLSRAVSLYMEIRLKPGTKKRILAPAMNRPVLARHTA